MPKVESEVPRPSFYQRGDFVVMEVATGNGEQRDVIFSNWDFAEFVNQITAMAMRCGVVVVIQPQNRRGDEPLEMGVNPVPGTVNACNDSAAKYAAAADIGGLGGARQRGLRG